MVIIEINGGKTESLESFRNAIPSKAVRHSVLWDEGNYNHEKYGISAWPVAYLIDRDGIVFWEGNLGRVINRPERLAELRQLLERKLQDPIRSTADRSR